MKCVAIIVIDFDDTITIADEFPEIAPMRKGARKVINKYYDRGHCIIINTCRDGIYQDMAKDWLIANGIKFCHINDNCDVRKKQYHNDTRKIGGHIFIDDKNLECLVAGGVNWKLIDMYLSYVLKKYPMTQVLCKERDAYITTQC